MKSIIDCYHRVPKLPPMVNLFSVKNKHTGKMTISCSHRTPYDAMYILLESISRDRKTGRFSNEKLFGYYEHSSFDDYDVEWLRKWIPEAGSKEAFDYLVRSKPSLVSFGYKLSEHTGGQNYKIGYSGGTRCQNGIYMVAIDGSGEPVMQLFSLSDCQIWLQREDKLDFNCKGKIDSKLARAIANTQHGCTSVEVYGYRFIVDKSFVKAGALPLTLIDAETGEEYEFASRKQAYEWMVQSGLLHPRVDYDQFNKHLVGVKAGGKYSKHPIINTNQPYEGFYIRGPVNEYKLTGRKVKGLID